MVKVALESQLCVHNLCEVQNMNMDFHTSQLWFRIFYLPVHLAPQQNLSCVCVAVLMHLLVEQFSLLCAGHLKVAHTGSYE